MAETNARVSVTIGTKADTAAVDRYTASVDRMRAGLKELFSSKSAATFGAAFGGSASAAGATMDKMMSRITEAIGGSSELASEMAQVERRVGLAGEAFQVLSRAGKASSEELIAAFAKYRVKLGDALGGDLGARKIFGDLGLSPEAQSRLPLERQLESLAVAVGRLKDRNLEAAATQEIFGRGYTALVPVLDRLRVDGYDKLRSKIAETAGVLGDDMSKALGKAKKEAAEATNQLNISLAPSNLRLLKMKSAVVGALSDNAGSIQSAGTALGAGFLAAATLSALASKIGPQLNVIGSQAASAFSHGFGVGAKLLPGIIAERVGGPAGVASFAALGRALATPFGAAFAVVLGGFLINELERISVEAINARDAKNATVVGQFRAAQDAVKSAASPEDAVAAQAAAAKFLAERQAEVEKLEKLRDTLAATKPVANMPKPEMSAADRKALEDRRTEVDLAIRLVQLANARGVEIAANNKAQREATDLAFAESEELEKTRARRAALMERETANRYEALSNDAARLEFLQQWRQQEAAAFAEKIAATKNAELAADRELEKRVRLADIDAKIAHVRQQAADAAARLREEAERELDRIMEKVDRERRGEIVRSLESELGRVAVERARVEGDFTRTSAEKWGARLDDLAARTAAVREAMSDMEARKTVAGAMGMSTEGHESELQRMQNELAQLEIDRLTMGPDPTSWVDQTAAALTALREQWGTSAQQIAGTISGTIGTAVDSVATNITQALLVTGDWNAALNSVAVSIGTELVRAIVAMGARWVATKIMMAVLDKTLAAGATAATAPLAAAQSAIWAGPATLATIATVGGAAAQAPLSIASAMAITQALAATPGFLAGGVAQGKQLAWLSEDGRPEYVLSAPAVENMGGIEAVEQLHRAALNPASPAAGVSSNSAKPGASPTRIVVVVDDGSPMQQSRIESLERDPRFRNVIKRMGREMRADWGIPS